MSTPPPDDVQYLDLGDSQTDTRTLQHRDRGKTKWRSTLFADILQTISALSKPTAPTRQFESARRSGAASDPAATVILRVIARRPAEAAEAKHQ
jgi:hypothetical protein